MGAAQGLGARALSQEARTDPRIAASTSTTAGKSVHVLSNEGITPVRKGC